MATKIPKLKSNDEGVGYDVAESEDEGLGYDVVQSEDEGQGDVEKGEELSYSDNPITTTSLDPMSVHGWEVAHPASIPTPLEELELKAQGEKDRKEKEPVVMTPEEPTPEPETPEEPEE